MDLDSIKTQIEDFEVQLNGLSEPINQIVQASFARGNDYYEAVKLLRESLYKLAVYQEIQKFHNQLIPYYLHAPAIEREHIRAFYRDSQHMLSALLDYPYHCADQIKSEQDIEKLRLGLAAISIEDFSEDYRDSLLALSELCVTAESAGIDPRPIFNEIADLSSDQVPAGGTVPVSNVLKEFQNYAVLHERRNDKRKIKS